MILIFHFAYLFINKLSCLNYLVSIKLQM